MAKLDQDPIKREIVCLLRAEVGVCYPSPRHAEAEEIYLLAGDLVVNGEVYGTGDYMSSGPGKIHSPHTVHSCLFFIRTSLNKQILNYKCSFVT